MNLRIAFVSNSAEDEATARLRWAIELQRRGFEVSFLLPSNDAACFERFERHGVGVIGIPLVRCRGKGLPVVLAKTTLQLRRRLRRSEFDVVHSFGHLANVCVCLGAATVARHLFLHVTGLGSLFAQDRVVAPRLLKAFYRLTQRNKTVSIIVQNRDDARDLGLAEGSGCVVVKGTGVDTDVWSPEAVDLEKVRAFRRSLSITDDVLIIAFVGRLLRQKGLFELRDAWRTVATLEPNCVLVVAGAGDPANPDTLPEAQDANWWPVRERVRLLGRISEVRTLLAACDMVVNPSYREGLPRVNVEAMAMGKPVITTDTVGCRETVRNNVNGLLVPARDAESLAQAVVKLLRSPELRHQFGVAGRERAVGEFDVRVIIDQVEDCYRTGGLLPSGMRACTLG